MIRSATYADIPAIIQCGKHFFEYAKFEENGLFLCELSFGKEVKRYIDSQNGIILLLISDAGDVVGGICGVIAPWSFNNSLKICHEYFYWVEPDHRGPNSIRLYNEFERRARIKGAHKMLMIDPNTGIGIDKLFDRLGFRKHQTDHIKDLI